MTADDKIEKAANGEEAAESEHPATEGTTEEEEAAINPCYYDKTKSFFDNLSCNDSRSVGSFSSVGQLLVSKQQKYVAEFELQKPGIASPPEPFVLFTKVQFRINTVSETFPSFNLAAFLAR